MRTGLLVKTAKTALAVVELLECLPNAGIEDGVVEHVLAVIARKYSSGFTSVFRSSGGCSTNEYRGAVPDIRKDEFVFERRKIQVCSCGSHRVRQIELRVDEGSVQVEDKEIQSSV